MGVEVVLDVVVGAIVALVYAKTSFLGIPGGDAGELAAEACNVGVAHPPGYPLFTWMGNAAVRFGPESWSPARRMNIACCLLGSLATTLLSATTRKVSLLRMPANGATPASRAAIAVIAASFALLAALSPHVWLYSTGVEVFVLNNALVAAILLTAAMYAESVLLARSDAGAEAAMYRFTLLGAFICGLALSNQHTSIFLILPVAAWVAASQWRSLAVARSISYIAAGLLGLLPYAHLPISHRWNRTLGSWGDASTLRGFLRHLLRQDYGTFRLISRSEGHVEGMLERTALYAKDLVGQQVPPLIVFPALLAVGCAVGLVSLQRKVPPASIKSTSSYSAKQPKHAPEHRSSSSPVSVTEPLREGNTTTRRRKQLATSETLSALAENQQGDGAGGTGLNLRDRLRSPGGKTVPSTSSRESTSDTHPTMDPEASADREGRAHLSPASQRAQRVAATLPALMVGCYAFYFLAFHGLSNMVLSEPLLYGIHARFWLQPNLIAFLLMGLGANALVLWIIHPPPPFPSQGSYPVRRNTDRDPLPAVSLALFGAVAVCYQYKRHLPAMDQSRNTVMNDYGRALLEPLPQGAILITGYDMQWTATRYLQACEGLRPDVQLFNSAVMSFAWFAAQRHLYPSVTFPGTHLVGHMTAPHAAGGFSLADFFAANLASDGGAALLRSYDVSKPHPDFQPRKAANIPSADRSVQAADGAPQRTGGVFFTGAPLFRDTAHAEQFDLLPHGIVERVVPKFGGARRRFSTWRNITKVDPVSDLAHRVGKLRSGGGTDAEAETARSAWAAATRVYNGSVPLMPYDDRTWEHATRLDFWAKAVNYAAWLLDWALQPAPPSRMLRLRPHTPGGQAASDEPRDMGGVLEAARVFEQAIAHQIEDNATVLPSTLKNLGLAYVRLVRSGQTLPKSEAWPRIPSHEAVCDARQEEAFRLAASRRVLQTWGAYLATPEASADPGNGSIAQVVQVLQGVIAKAGGSVHNEL